MNTATALSVRPYGQSVDASLDYPAGYVPYPTITRTSNAGCSTLGANVDSTSICCPTNAVYWLAAAVAAVAVAVGANVYVKSKKKR